MQRSKARGRNMEQLRRIIGAWKLLPLIGLVVTALAVGGCGGGEAGSSKFTEKDREVARELVRTPEQRRAFAKVCSNELSKRQFVRIAKEQGVGETIAEFGGRITPVLELLYMRC
jgi:hypothetical protein